MTQNKIRNFVIIAHIDHGKSTLADRFLELTHTVAENKMHPQYLDALDLEKERQITIKLAPVRMEYKGYIFNLIDTPGHVDFSYEVSRSLAAVEGAILLVDVKQGIQAQTLAVLELAQIQNLKIIPVLNKIDLPQVETEKRRGEISELLNIPYEKILKISAKTGEGVEALLEKIISDFPGPKGEESTKPKALIFDSIYDPFRGVIASVRIFEGEIHKNDKIKFIATNTEAKVVSIGVFKPERQEKDYLLKGEIGFIATNIKEIEECQVGDTITLSPASKNFKGLSGYKKPQPNIFVSLFSTKGDSEKLRTALDQLKLNDSSLEFRPEVSPILGAGFRSGFLGMLHLEIIKERIEREHNIEVIFSSPSVSYNVIKRDGTSIKINNPDEFIQEEIQEIQEPIMKVEILFPNNYLGSVSELLKQKRGQFLSSKYLDKDKVLLIYKMPLANLIWGFYDDLKTYTSGMGSFNYQFLDYESADLVKIDILIAGEKFPAFSQIVYQDEAQTKGRKLVEKLKTIIPKQMFEVAVQAVVGSKIIARENISAMRKDVIAKLYGGDRTRKDKLLKKQKAGKKKMKSLGKMSFGSDVFWRFLKES